MDISPQSPMPVLRLVTRTLRGQHTSDGAGVALTRVIGGSGLSMIDPFLMLDVFHSDDPDAYIAGFPDHPHRGFETITYMLAGRLRHRDNKGHEGLLGPGDVQWMTAARGIVHSEMPEQEEGLMRGFQLWLNLPAKDKMGPARYQDIAAAAIPTLRRGGATIKLLAGRVDGVDGPIASAATQPVILDLLFDAEDELDLPIPASHHGFAFVYEGQAEVSGTLVPADHAAVLGDGEWVHVMAAAGTRLLLVAGHPLHEPVARYGPFVMNTKEEIFQAVQDYNAGLF